MQIQKAIWCWGKHIYSSKIIHNYCTNVPVIPNLDKLLSTGKQPPQPQPYVRLFLKIYLRFSTFQVIPGSDYFLLRTVENRFQAKYSKRIHQEIISKIWYSFTAQNLRKYQKSYFNFYHGEKMSDTKDKARNLRLVKNWFSSTSAWEKGKFDEMFLKVVSQPEEKERGGAWSSFCRGLGGLIFVIIIIIIIIIIININIIVQKIAEEEKIFQSAEKWPVISIWSFVKFSTKAVCQGVGVSSISNWECFWLKIPLAFLW